MIDAKTCINDAQEKMDMAVMYLEEALAHIRAGKASTRLLDGIRVDSYGSMVPISNVAAVTTPDARSIVIKPWDKSMFRIIEKAIMDSELGITPENNGEIIRLGIPPLTEERRKQLAKQCKGEGETANSKYPQRTPRCHRRFEESRKRRHARRRTEKCRSQTSEGTR